MKKQNTYFASATWYEDGDPCAHGPRHGGALVGVSIGGASSASFDSHAYDLQDKEYSKMLKERNRLLLESRAKKSYAQRVKQDEAFYNDMIAKRWKAAMDNYDIVATAIRRVMESVVRDPLFFRCYGGNDSAIFFWKTGIVKGNKSWRKRLELLRSKYIPNIDPPVLYSE
jgi:hypothetical protein